MLSKEARKERNQLFWDAFKEVMRKRVSCSGSRVNWPNYPTKIKNTYLRLISDGKLTAVCFDIQFKDENIGHQAKCVCTTTKAAPNSPAPRRQLGNAFTLAAFIIAPKPVRTSFLKTEISDTKSKPVAKETKAADNESPICVDNSPLIRDCREIKTPERDEKIPNNNEFLNFKVLTLPFKYASKILLVKNDLVSLLKKLEETDSSMHKYQRS